MRFKAHDYQQRAITAILNNPAYGLFLDMGLGKTVITLMAIKALLFDRYEVRKVLIIAPKKVAESTWVQEARKWDDTKGLRVSLVLGTKAQRQAALARDADVYVCTRDNIADMCAEYGYRLPFDMLVIDEASSFKNPQSKRFKALRKARGSFSRVLLLTGTPAPNSLLDLWAPLYLLDGGERLGRTLTAYRMRFFTPGASNGFVVYNYKLRPGARQEITRLIRDVCMSMTARDYITLPPRVDNVVPVELGTKAQAVYKKLAREYVLDLDSEEQITALSAAAVAGKLLQLANGAMYTDAGAVKSYHGEKLAALKEITEANEGLPVLVFYAFKFDRDRLLETFKDARELKTDKDVEDWNAGRVPMLITHPAASGYGLNLQTGGNIIVWYGLTWSLEQYQQANARLCRQGQKNTVIIHHLVATGTVDEKVMRVLTGKDESQRAIIDALKEARGRASDGDRST